MATANVPNTIVAGDPASAAPLEGNYTYIESFLNNSVTHTDGTKPFTGLPSVVDGIEPSASGDLVHKAYVDQRVGVLEKRIKFDGSLWASGSSWTDLGSGLAEFTWPEILPNASFTISLFVPEFTQGPSNPVLPAGQVTLDVGIMVGTADGAGLVQKGSCMSDPLGALGGDQIPSLSMERTFFDNSTRAAGTPTEVFIMGRHAGSSGQFKLQGSANAPIELLARLG